MAKEDNNDRILVSEERVTNTILSKDGHEEFSIDFVRHEYEDPEGNVDYQITNAKHTETGDGTIISGTQISQPESRGGVTLQRCDGCMDESKTFLEWLLHRNLPKLTFSPAKKMRRCFSCRRNFCEKHYVLTNRDKHIRCRKCDQKFKRNQVLLKIIKFIFLKKHE